MKKRLLSILLALCMSLALLPVTAFAASGGACGENAAWILDGNGHLLISGTGSMSSYGDDGDRHITLTPWHTQLLEITSVVLEDGITGIGASAFVYCTNLAGVTIPGSVISIGKEAFFGCNSLTDIYYDGSESQWKQIAVDEGNDDLLNAAIHYNSDSNAGSGGAAPTEPSTPTTPPDIKAVLSPQNLEVDGKNIECEKYNIDNSNYFKLRDLAQLLSGTGSQFGVGFDEGTSTVAITTGEVYESTGTELAAGVDNSATARPSAQSIQINGETHGELTVYNIGGSNFFQLRELGELLGFEVDYDIDTNTAIVRSIQK